MQIKITNYKKFWFSVLAVLDNKFFTTMETLEILASLHYTLDTAYIIRNIKMTNVKFMLEYQ